MRNRLDLAALVLVTALVASGCNSPHPAAEPDPTESRPTLAAASATPSATRRPSNTPTMAASPTSTPTGLVSLVAVGDIMLGRTVGEQVLAKGPQVVFAGVQPILNAADIRIGNLECALTDTGSPEPKKTFTLKAPPAAAEALRLGKFDLLSLANNHAMDYGYAGLRAAQKNLARVNIATVGAGADFTEAHAPVILQRNGLRLAFLGYMDVPEERDGFDARDWIAAAARPGVAWADPSEIAADVTAAKSKADLVIVLLHSGTEIGDYQSVLSGAQLEAAHAAIDAGAALVVGSHPHQLESIERYHGGLIAYSLGNFVFDDYRGVANATILLQVTLDRNGVQGYKYVPALIQNGLPQVVPPERVPVIGTLVAP